MTLTKEQIRDKYLRNEIFLIGESLGHGLEVIDRRSNYIVVVDENGADKKMFLDEAHALMVENANRDHSHLVDGAQVVFRKGNFPNHGSTQPPQEGYPLKVEHVSRDDRGNVVWVGVKTAGGTSYRVNPDQLHPHIKEETSATRWNILKEKFQDPAFAYKGYRTKHFNSIPQAQPVFEQIIENTEDPYAVLTAIKQLDIFMEKKDKNSFERAKNAISRVDSLENHPYLVESLISVESTNVELKLFKDFEVDDDFDFPIEEKLTYSSFKTALTEDFKNHAESVMDHLEKNPKELDSLAQHVRTLKDIAHHYDNQHLRVHMGEGKEESAIREAEKISVVKPSGANDIFKVAKRAAVTLIAQKMANKPLKKVSKKEKNVILDLIKKKKGVVFRLVKKLVPKIKHIEQDNLDDEVGTAE